MPVANVFSRPRPPELLIGWSREAPVIWRGFHERVAAIAALLAARPAPGAVLACSRPLDFLAALLALWHCRRLAVVPPSLQPDAIAALVSADAPLLGDAELDRLQDIDKRLDLPDAAECRLALYTSGSSGAPKRVDKTLAQLDREIENLHAAWGAALAGHAVLATVPHFHIYGLLFRLLWPFAAGCPADDTTSADPVALRAVANRRGPCVLVSTPAHLERFPQLLSLAEWRRPSLVFSSGGPLGATSAALFREAFGAAPIEVFGSTETGGVAWRQRDGGAHEDAWTPFPGIRVGLDADDALILDSVYLPTRGWRMDDAAEFLPDGRFLLRGRLDRVVKIEGKRLSLPELELKLQAHAWVESACAVVLPAPHRLGVVIVPSAAGGSVLARYGTHAMRSALRQHLARVFDATLLPRRFCFVAELPLDERGKTAAQSLKDLFRAGRHADN